MRLTYRYADLHPALRVGIIFDIGRSPSTASTLHCYVATGVGNASWDNETRCNTLGPRARGAGKPSTSKPTMPQPDSMDARPPTADRRPPTADRRPPTATAEYTTTPEPELEEGTLVEHESEETMATEHTLNYSALRSILARIGGSVSRARSAVLNEKAPFRSSFSRNLSSAIQSISCAAALDFSHAQR
jgi:hypothetical protein